MADAAALTRRRFLSGALAAGITAASVRYGRPAEPGPALISVTLDLEMSRHYPLRGDLEWDYRKGQLDAATKQYTVDAAAILKRHGGRLHTFCVGQVLEQPDTGWLEQLAADGHAIGNHTYDHVNVKATRREDIQFRFQRAPWLIAGREPAEIIRHNIEMTTRALRERTGVEVNGFRTPGGFSNGLTDRPDVRAMLRNLGFRWISSGYPKFQTGGEGDAPDETVFRNIVDAQKAAQPFVYDDGLIEIPMSPISDVHAFRSLRWSVDAWLEALRRSVTWAIETGGVFDFLAHPSCLVVEDPQLRGIELVCRLVSDAGPRARLATLDIIAGRAGA